eukprot:9807597-Alexandrium_andersonii.AAC.1
MAKRATQQSGKRRASSKPVKHPPRQKGRPRPAGRPKPGKDNKQEEGKGMEHPPKLKQACRCGPPDASCRPCQRKA